MAACPKSRPQNRKRQRAEADLAQDDLHSLPSKKFKSTWEHPQAFYDSLSKVSLTRGALRELDRWDQLKRLTHKPIRQLSSCKDLEQFDLHGGPELGDLRGVRLNYPNCIMLSLTMPV